MAKSAQAGRRSVNSTSDKHLRYTIQCKTSDIPMRVFQKGYLEE